MALKQQAMKEQIREQYLKEKDIRVITNINSYVDWLERKLLQSQGLSDDEIEDLKKDFQKHLTESKCSDMAIDRHSDNDTPTIHVSDAFESFIRKHRTHHPQVTAEREDKIKKVYDAIDYTIKKSFGEYPKDGEYEVTFLYPANNKAFQLLKEAKELLTTELTQD